MSHQKCVLIVDDEPINLLILSQVLKPCFAVFACKSGEEALQVARRIPKPDLVILDILMPGMDGYMTLFKLRQDPETADIPVIFISALSNGADLQKGLELGAVDFIVKPFESEDIMTRVKAQLH